MPERGGRNLILFKRRGVLKGNDLIKKGGRWICEAELSCSDKNGKHLLFQTLTRLLQRSIRNREALTERSRRRAGRP